MWIDLKVVKKSVSMKQILDHYGISLRNVNGAYLRGQCPLPTHSSKESKYSFSVNTERSLWTCKSDSCVKTSGRRGGNILDFVAVMEGVAVVDAAKKILEWFPTNGNSPSVEERRPEPVVQDNSPLGFELKDVSYHCYLDARGVTKETAEKFGVGFFPGKGSMLGRIVIPIHNERGQLLAYAGRSIDNSEPKYKLPGSFKKSLVLFNLHRVLTLPEHRCVIVVEGFFDVVKIHQAGFPYVVALMGSSLSETQERLLTTNFQQIVIAMDGDDTGQKASKEITIQLSPKVFVRVAEIAQGRQPDELCDKQIQDLLSGCI